jgi:phage minor structural protein
MIFRHKKSRTSQNEVVFFIGGDYLHVIDLEDNEYPLQATTTNEYELNGNQNLSMKILPSKANKLFIEKLTEMWTVVDHDDVSHKIIYFKRQGEGDTQSIDIKAIPLFFDDMNSLRIYDRYDQHMTAQACFNIIFEDSGYNFILNGSFDAIDWEGFGEGDTRLTMLKNALNRYSAEFRIVGNTIYIENLIGRDTQFMYRYRLNASNIVLEHDASEFYTYAIGYGDYGDGEGSEDWQDANLIREYTSPLAEIPGIGIRHAPPIKNGNITITETMDEQLKTLVDESLKISVSATLHDLRKQNYPLAQPQMGDRVFLIDERIGLNDEVRVVDMSLVRNWKGEVLDINLTFGTPGLVKRHQAELESARQAINDLINGRRKLPWSVYDARVQEATRAMQNVMTELTVPPNGGLMAVDKDDPNNVVIYNAAGLFVSEDGGATASQAIWGGGINASVITAGDMLADRIAGGILRALNGNFEFDMNNGRMDFHSGARIEFHNDRNHLLRIAGGATGGINFTISQGDTRPMMAVGVNSGSGIDVNASSFQGLRAHPRDSDHTTNIVAAYQFLLLNRANHTNGGFAFRTGFHNDVSRSIHPMTNPDNWTYNLGRAGSQWRWSNVFLKEQPDVQSDERLKKNIRDNPLGLDFIRKISTKEYVMNNTEDQRKRYGIIAQQLIASLESSNVDIADVNIVSEGEDGMYGVQETQLIAPVIKSLQEIADRLEVVENRTA